MNEYQYIKNGAGLDFDYAQDHVYVKLSSHDTHGELCMVEDHLKPGFYLANHYHKVMTEVFYILDGEFEITFGDKQVKGAKGDTITVPPGVWHMVRSEHGARLITLFKNGCFDAYLEKISQMTADDFKNADLMTAVAEEYDIFYQ